jgi:predicted HicB family RNase H-like nuclease
MTSTIYLRVPAELKKTLEKRASEMGLSLNAYIIVMLAQKEKKK